MSAAVKDLPDPLDPSPTMALSNPDDLLAKMADEAIDRLMAEADKGASPTMPPVPMDAVSDGAEAVAEPTGVADLGVAQATPAGEAATEPILPHSATESVHETAAANVPAHGSFEPTDALHAAVAASAAATEATTSASSVAAGHHGAEPAATASTPPAPAADLRALLHDDHSATPTRPSPLLWPLWLLNLPFSGMSDDARRIFGLLGVVTLVPAATAIAFVIWMKRH